jgi:hypothetical protein
MAYLETDTNTNLNISSATEIGSYTAAADGLIYCDVLVDQIVGGDDYLIWATRQIGGAGSAGIIGPVTTIPVATSVTHFSAQGIPISVRSGDVVKIYVDGLAGDTTTPDTTVRWYDWTPFQAAGYTAPLTAPQTAAAVLDAVAASYDDAGSIGEAINDGANVTLAVSAVTAAAAASGSLGIVTYMTFDATITSTSTLDMTAATKIYWAVKSSVRDLDAASLTLVEKTAGLTVVLGATPYATPAHGSITVTGSSGAWSFALHLDEVVAGLLSNNIGSAKSELKVLIGGSAYQIWVGDASIGDGVIKAVA